MRINFIAFTRSGFDGFIQYQYVARGWPTPIWSVSGPPDKCEGVMGIVVNILECGVFSYIPAMLCEVYLRFKAGEIKQEDQ